MTGSANHLYMLPTRAAFAAGMIIPPRSAPVDR
jgi:hypothetical protein